MTPKLQHTLIRASAGTGKTYQLANRFIALLLLQAQSSRVNPESLVALTFTRKGAAEFASRILGRLASAALKEETCQTLEKDIQLLINGDEPQGPKGLAPGVALTVDRHRMRGLLAALVDQMDRLCLGTIDSFMARSVQTLAFELGLGGFEILEQPADEIARREILGEVFRAAGNSDLTAFHQAIKRATLKSSASLRTELNRFAAGFHEMVLTISHREGWGGKDFWIDPQALQGPADWKARARNLGEQVDGLDFGHAGINSTLRDVLKWLAERDPETAVGTIPGWIKEDGLLCKAWRKWPAGDLVFDYSQKSRTFPAELMAELRPILGGWLAAELRALADKTQALFTIISAYETAYDECARRRGRLSFADLPVLLKPADDEAAAQVLEKLAFRWYQEFDHWLLDEFQDTSRAQWAVLHPWLDEAIQDNEGTKSVFVVGDVKQSIYGWRGGEPRLFNELVDRYPGVFSEQVMLESWRSRPAVLSLVNTVCTPSNPALQDPKKFSPEALSRWDYQPHHCAPSRMSHEGYAAVILTPTEADAQEETAGNDEIQDERLAPRARIIQNVIEQLDPLGKGLSCAILTRKGDDAHGLAQCLRVLGLRNVMVEGDATLAEQSPLIACLLDALRWLDTPANSLAAGHLQLSPLWKVLAAIAARTETGEPPAAGLIWRRWRDRLGEIGAPAVTGLWCGALDPEQLTGYNGYCVQQVEQLAHRSQAGLSLADWIASLEALTVRETSAAGCIHVMTIHKAKGLGFDLVFLPDLDIGRRNNSDELLLRKDGQGVPVGCLRGPRKFLTAWSPALGELRTKAEADDALEELCVLYVALTRAKEATFVIMSGEPERSKTALRDWVLDAVPACAVPPDDPARWKGGLLQWERGNPALLGEVSPVAAGVAYQPDLKLQTPQPRRVRRKPSEASHAPLKPGKALIAANFMGQNFGTEVHKVFEQIEWWTPALKPQGTEAALKAALECLCVPEIQALFTRNNARDEVYRELPLEFIEGDTWWSGVVDRLVLRYDSSQRLSRAILIDFKTDKVSAPEELQKRYAKQVAVYQRALKSALHLDANAVEVLLVSTHLKVVVSGC